MAVAVAAVVPSEPADTARVALLRYVDDSGPGIRREPGSKGFRYRDPQGTVIQDAATLLRIKALAIPPAWTDVWICPHANGHIQATGRDRRNRKQYRYHPDWRAARDQTKYHRMQAFGRALPAIRRRVEEDLALPGLMRERVIAAVVRLLDATYIRIGNEEYARENRSFGLTTMRSRHATVTGSKITFEFRGKAGKLHSVELRDRRLARIVQRCQELPGHELFQYLDDAGNRHSVSSHDVNDYLSEAGGDHFTAKDFRTWAGTVLAAWALQEVAQFDSSAAAKRGLLEAIERVARKLGNTTSVCRACYVHPEVIDAYLDGTLVDSLTKKAERVLKDDLPGLSAEEAAVLALLHRRMARANRRGQDARKSA